MMFFFISEPTIMELTIKQYFQFLKENRAQKHILTAHDIQPFSQHFQQQHTGPGKSEIFIFKIKINKRNNNRPLQIFYVNWYNSSLGINRERSSIIFIWIEWLQVKESASALLGVWLHIRNRCDAKWVDQRRKKMEKKIPTEDHDEKELRL